MNKSEFWNRDDNEQGQQPTQSSKVTDLSFRLQCRCLSVDHTYDLHRAITDALPWFTEEPLTGLHLIHVAGSQNGWMRPENPDEMIYLSNRTRLTIRLPVHRVKDARTLTGHELDIAGNTMKIGEASERAVLTSDILLARHVIGEQDETDFLQSAASQLEAMGIQFRKLLTGKHIRLRSPEGEINTRSLMVAELNPADSLTLQENGIGHGRRYGCGIFIHHKGIKAINPDNPE